MTSLETHSVLRQQVINILSRLEMNNMLFSAKAVDVKIIHDNLTVTLRGIMSKAEQHFANNQQGKTFLQTLYARQLVFLQQGIEGEINHLLNKKCIGAELVIEPEPGDVILTLLLSDS